MQILRPHTMAIDSGTLDMDHRIWLFGWSGLVWGAECMKVGHYVQLGIEPGSDVCKASAQLTI